MDMKIRMPGSRSAVAALSEGYGVYCCLTWRCLCVAHMAPTLQFVALLMQGASAARRAAATAAAGGGMGALLAPLGWLQKFDELSEHISSQVGPLLVVGWLGDLGWVTVNG